MSCLTASTRFSPCRQLPYPNTPVRPPQRRNIDAVVAGPLRILVYSNNPRTREQVRLALGKRIHPELPELAYVDVATAPMVITQMDAGGFDLAILDGEATPAGGMGVAKQLKDEVAECPPILVLTGRPDDAWLASWSRAEAAVPHPIDPIRLADAVVSLLRSPVR